MVNNNSKPIAYHMTTRLRDDRVIAPTVAQRRTLASIVFRQARKERLLAFSAPDTHMHILVANGRTAAGKLAHRVEVAVKRRLQLEVGFSQAEFEPVRDQSHLRNAFIYIMRQYQRHGVQSDPCHEASNLPDLLGIRITGQFTVAHVRLLLPRIQRLDLLPYLGVDDPREGALPPPAHVTEAAAAAVGLPALLGSTRMVVEARVAVVKMLRGVVPGNETARLLGISPRSVRRMTRQKVDDRIHEAVRQQMLLRHRVAMQTRRSGAL